MIAIPIIYAALKIMRREAVAFCLHMQNQGDTYLLRCGCVQFVKSICKKLTDADIDQPHPKDRQPEGKQPITFF